MSKFTQLLLTFFLLLYSSNCTVTTGVGVTGLVVLDERSVGNIIDDKVLFAKIMHQYTMNSLTNLLKNLSLRVYEGRVLLVGDVMDTESRETAETLVWSVRGVKEVINEIVVLSQDNINLQKDIKISTQLRVQLVMNRGINLINYRIISHNQVLYLLGMAKTQKELNNILAIASRVNGVRKVKSYILLSNDVRR